MGPRVGRECPDVAGFGARVSTESRFKAMIWAKHRRFDAHVGGGLGRPKRTVVCRWHKRHAILCSPAGSSTAVLELSSP
jgi:hypothetical protein